MLTPRFSLDQDENFIIITIRAPYCNIKELETYIDGTDFRFVSSPYYLRLNLPGKIIEDNSACGEFSSDDGVFVFKYSKVNKGEHFEGLDFITSLLAPAKRTTKPEIEVVEESEFRLTSPDQEGDEWHSEQVLPKDDISIVSCKYGFANQKTNLLQSVGFEFTTVFDIRNVDKISISERSSYRLDTESMAFNAEYYVCDYYDENIKEIIIKTNPWIELLTKSIHFDENEKDVLKDFPNREYILNEDEVNAVLYGLIDILFAYAYDRRTTDYEGTCESGWTITKLSATLSWFDSFTNEKDTIISGFRRSLIYPLYRNFDLALQVLEDLKLLLNLGQIFIVKCLLNIYDIFSSSSDPHYILNDLYIKDYIIYMQKCPKDKLQELITKVQELQISEDDLKLNLKQALEDMKHYNVKADKLSEKLSKLNIMHCLPVESESDSESDSSEDSSTDSDDTSSSDTDSST